MRQDIKTALVTGATSGIGRATAVMLARLGYHVAITGRRLPLLQDLSREIERTSGVESYILNYDASNKYETFDAYDMLPDSWKRHLLVLVNNAGLALGLESFEEADDRDWETMIDTNVKGLLYTSQLVARTMKENGAGLIVNVSSIAARQTYAAGHVYCATKKAVDAITEGMRIDLHPYGVKVATVAPGKVATEFSRVRFKGDDKRAAQVYEGMRPLSATDVAAAIEFIVTRPAHVAVHDILIMPAEQLHA